MIGVESQPWQLFISENEIVFTRRLQNKQTKTSFGYSIAKWSWSQSFIQNVWASSLCEITPPLSPPPLYRTQAHGHPFQSFITNLHTSETGQMTRLCLVPYQLSSWLPLCTPGHRGHEIRHRDFPYQAWRACLWSQCPGSRVRGNHCKIQATWSTWQVPSQTHIQSEACLKHTCACRGMVFRNSESKRRITWQSKNKNAWLKDTEFCDPTFKESRIVVDVCIQSKSRNKMDKRTEQ